ncbi:MAG: GatB/YqeY domain-containing protein [Patescibacteria group bacterium]|jgi:hypothetical protein
MTIREQIVQDLTRAQKDQDQKKVSTLRMLVSALQNAEISNNRTYTDDIALTTLRKEVKKRQDAADMFVTGGRPELAEKEREEVVMIQAYLPQQVSRDVVVQEVQKAIDGTDAAQRNFGTVMKAAMQTLQGKADGKVVSEVVRELLT